MTDFGPGPKEINEFLVKSYTAISWLSLIEFAARYRPLLEIAIFATDFYSLLLKTFLVSIVIGSHTIIEGRLPISPVAAKFLPTFKSKQVISLL